MSKMTISENRLHELIQESIYGVLQEAQYDEGLGHWLGNLWQSAKNKWNNFKGEDVFLIDAGVFPGSSGSPVFIYNRGTYPTKDGIAVGSRLMFVGVIAQTMLRDNSTGKDYLNLGKVINSRAMYVELQKFVKKLKGTM